MKVCIAVITGVLALLLLAPTDALRAAEPQAALQGPMEEALSILRDPQYKDAARKTEHRRLIWEVVYKVFDFEEVSRRALARDWVKLSPEQQEEFSQVFSDVLGNVYLDRIQGAYQDETIAYLAEVVHESKPLAVVKTHIVRKSGNIPVDYSLHKTADGWRVYDVKVEGVSLIKNYRTQFQEILSKDSPAQLIVRLREKLAEQRKTLDSQS
jgi:phospholipid transport system substrate-binding protein